MKLYFMKQSAIDFVKANMNNLYLHYFRDDSNEWIREQFGEEPFQLFKEVPDFSLTPYNKQKGKMELENSKILYRNLRKNLDESQASDERLWAGMCHTTFYQYVRVRWDYPTKKLSTPDKDISEIVSRFFFSGGTRSGCYRNTLAKCWWAGHGTYQANAKNKFELLDFLGANDFHTKINDLFYSNTFSSNPVIVRGICKGWKTLTDRGLKLTVKEHFRPALQSMNSLGGGILLDILSEEEIQDAFVEYVSHLYSKDRPQAMVFEDENMDEEDDREGF